MNVPLIKIERTEAIEKLKEYKSLSDKQRTVEDEKLKSLYKAVSNGGQVINVAEVFRFAGLNDKGQPKLAIARADQKTIWFHPRQGTGDDNRRWQSNIGSGGFSPIQSWQTHYKSQNYALPRNVFDDAKLTRSLLKSPVPHIPPKLRPTISLTNFHILFEVEKWFEYPADPYLLRHITGHLFVVVGEWELTELEVSLLAGMRSGN